MRFVRSRLGTRRERVGAGDRFVERVVREDVDDRAEDLLMDDAILILRLED